MAEYDVAVLGGDPGGSYDRHPAQERVRTGRQAVRSRAGRPFVVMVAMMLLLGPGVVAARPATTAADAGLHFERVEGVDLPDGPVRIAEGRDGALYLAASGKGGLLAAIDGAKFTVLARGDVGCVATAADGKVWYTMGERVLAFAPAEAASPVDYTETFGGPPAGLRRIYCGRLGGVWVEGCPKMRGSDGAFREVMAFPLGGHAPVAELAGQCGNLWGLMRARGDPPGTSVVTAPAGMAACWSAFGPGDGLREGRWDAIVADEFAFVWVAGAGGLLRFDPRRPQAGWKSLPEPGLGDETVTALGLSATGRAIAGLRSGKLLELDVHVKPRRSTVIRRLDATGLARAPVRAIHCDRKGRTWVVAGARVYRAEAPRDASVRTWAPLSPLPYGNHDVFGAVADGRVYVPGGMAAHGLPAAFRNFDRMFVYDVAADRWSVTPPMSRRRCYAGVATIGRKVWVVGGRTNPSGKTAPLDLVEIYDPKTGRWRTGPPLPSPRTEAVVVAAGGRVYAIGGRGPGDAGSVFSIADGQAKWRDEAKLPVPQTTQAAGCVLDGIIYVYAGADGHGLIAYDPVKRKWKSDFPKLPDDSVPVAALMASHKGELWVMGGYKTRTPRATWIYSLKHSAWRRGPDLPGERNWGAAVAVGGRLIIAGGAHYSRQHGYYVFTDTAYMLRDGDY